MTIHLLCQVLPFFFYTYLIFEFLLVFVPMQGRDGPDSKPDMLLAAFIALMTMHFSGFIVSLLTVFLYYFIFIYCLYFRYPFCTNSTNQRPLSPFLVF